MLDEGSISSEEEKLIGETKVKFIFNNSYRFHRAEMKRKIDLIRSYSEPEFARACGRQAEVLFFNSLTNIGFIPKGQETRQYKRKIWKETEHDLDFIIKRDGIPYGVEVKNKLRYIEKEELKVKLSMCEYLGLRPLFIMRYSPKTQNLQ